MIELIILGVGVFAYGMVSKRLSLSPITAPMVYTVLGLILGVGGLGWFDLDLGSSLLVLLVETTLVLVLFTDAIRIDLRMLRGEALFPARLLGIGLPATFLLGVAAAFFVFDRIDLATAGLIAAVLTPTDAALGQAVVSDQRLPIQVRQGLNVESGLNDGLVVPLVTVMIGLAATEADQGGLGEWTAFAGGQIGLGLGWGILAGTGGGWLLRTRSLAGKVEGVYQQLATLAVAAVAYAGAESTGGNGFIAAFVAGLALGAVAREQCRNMGNFSEDQSELLSAITFLVFGAAVAGSMLETLTWDIALYSVLSLTVIRGIPVVVSLWRSGTLMETRLFVAWFGPRGLASILFALLVVEQIGAPGTELVYRTATWTVLFSIFAHGLTAAPWSGRLARRLEAAGDDMPEMRPGPQMPTRRSLG